MSIRRLFRNSGVYAVGEVLQNGAAFLLLPFYSYHLSPSEFGIAVVTTTVALVSAELLSLGVHNVVIRFTFDDPDNPRYLASLYQTLFTFASVLWLVISLVAFAGLAALVYADAMPASWLPLASAAILLAATHVLYDMHQRRTQANGLASRYIIQRLAYFAISSGTAIYLILQANLGGLSIVLGAAAASASMAGLVLATIARHSGFGIDRALLKACLKYSIHLMPNKVASFAPSIADRVLLSRLSVHAVGLYGMAYRLTDVLALILAGFHRSYQPWFFGNMRNPTGRAEIDALAWRVMLVVTLLGLLGSYIAKPFVEFFLADPYHGAWRLVPLLAFATVFVQLKDFGVGPMTFDKAATRFMPLATIPASGITVLLIAVGVVTAGAIGAAAGLLLGRIVGSAFMLLLMARKTDYPYGIAKLALISIAGVCLLPLAYITSPSLVILRNALAIVATGGVAWVVLRTPISRASFSTSDA